MWGAVSTKLPPFLSNFGVLNSESVNFGEVEVTDAYMVGPVLYPPNFMLAVSILKF